MNVEPITILIAEDHPIYRRGLRAVLEAEPDMECIGEATTGEEVIDLASARQPDVILMDIQMPRLSGLEATHHILRKHPAVRILMLTYSDDQVSEAMRTGAWGYVMKADPPERLLSAIRAVHRGNVTLSSAIATQALRPFAHPPSPVPTQEERAFPGLTESEWKVLELLAQGRTNQDIAQTLSLAPKTVRNYVSSIYSKLQVTNRGDAILHAQNAGVGKRVPES